MCPKVRRARCRECGVERPLVRCPVLTVFPSSADRIEAHGDAIYSIAVHPSNPDLIATASGDDTGALWNRATKQRIATLSGHTDTVVQVAFNTSGSLLATAGMDGVVKVWNSADGALVATLEGPGEDITFINWHSKGDVLLAGSSDASVWMWNAASGSCMAVLSGHSESVTCGMFSQDGKTVVTASADGSARVWNPKDSSCLVAMSDPKVLDTRDACETSLRRFESSRSARVGWCYSGVYMPVSMILHRICKTIRIYIFD